MNYGTLYGVSLGPGDPGLITRRAWSLLQKDNVCWTYPVRNNKSNSYALDIALRAGLTLPAEYQSLVFPMTHAPEKLAGYRLRAAETVVEKLRTGRDVLFLVEGDASTYSTFGHLSRTVRALDESIHIETIAGVPAYNAAAAQLQTPLADVDDTIAIIPAGYGLHVIEALLPQFDTLVLLKVKPLLDDILALLEQKGLTQHARFIEKAGAPEQRIIEDITLLNGEKVNYLSLMLIRNPDRQRGELIRGCRKKTDITPMPEENTL